MWGSWGMPMWGFGWLIPLIAFAFCLIFVVVMMRVMGRARGGHERSGDDMADLRREVRELREEVSRLKMTR
jgi:uncharacterized membrane protein